MVCIYDLAYVFAMMFFTAALFLNAIRWVELISNLKILVDQANQSKFKKRIVGGTIVTLVIVSIFRMVSACSVNPTTDDN